MLLTEINLLKQNYVADNRRQRSTKTCSNKTTLLIIVAYRFCFLCCDFCFVWFRNTSCAQCRLCTSCAQCRLCTSCAQCRLCRTFDYQLLIAPLVFYNVYYLYMTLPLFWNQDHGFTVCMLISMYSHYLVTKFATQRRQCMDIFETG